MSYRKVDQRLWTSNTFRSLSEDARTLYQYLLTSPHNNVLCCYVLPELYAAHDLQWLPERLKEPLKELLSKRRPDETPMIYRDEAGVTFVYGQLAKEGLVNVNAVKAAIKVLNTMPTYSPVYQYVFDEVNILSSQTDKQFHKPLLERLQERLKEPITEPITYPRARVQEQEQEQEQDNPPYIPPSEPLRGKSQPPPYSEIVEYLNEKVGKNFDPKAKETQRHIKARWNAGFRLKDFKKVIDVKVAKWATNDEMVDFLRPQTLFGTKFESYLNESFPSPRAPTKENGGVLDPTVCRECGKRANSIIDGLCPSCRDNPVAKACGMN